MVNEALRLLRVFHDMKSTKLAEKLGLSPSYLSEIEKGKKAPSLDLIKRYAAEFETSPSAILSMAESLEREPIGFKNRLTGMMMKFLQEIENVGSK